MKVILEENLNREFGFKTSDFATGEVFESSNGAQYLKLANGLLNLKNLEHYPQTVSARIYRPLNITRVIIEPKG